MKNSRLSLQRLTTTSLALGCAALTASAQSTQITSAQMQGMMTNAALGLWATTPPGAPAAPGNSTGLVVRNSGVANTPAQNWSAGLYGAANATHPDYSQASLILGLERMPHAVGVSAAPLDFGGFSTGGGMCPPLNSSGGAPGGSSR